ncbi:MAG: BTAD domain-containing putative transcriptional regulator [Armatimonadota bacterium]|nr:BTAD domain-containing putative transcriptional regulator [Armatimonadota bacterium]
MSSRRLAYLSLLSAITVLANSTLAYSGTIAPQKPVRSILICYFAGPTDYQSRSVGAAVGRMLRYRASNLYQLSNLPPLNVVERIMRENRLSGRLSLKTPDALKIARASGQEWVLTGSVKRIGDKFLISAEIFGVSTGRMIGGPISVSGSEADLPRLETDLARNIFAGIGVQFSARQRAELSKPLTNNPKAIRLLGDFLLAKRELAPGFLSKLTALDPYFALGAVHRADQLLDAARYQEVIELARLWSRRLPRNRDFPSYEFGALVSLGRYGEASAALKRIDANYPNSFSVTLLRHWLDRVQGNAGAALETARMLTELNPASSEGYGRLAIASLEHGLRIGESLDVSQMNPGKARDFEKDIETACLAGETAVGIDPRYEDMWLALMAAYREQGRHGKSLQAYRKVMSLNAQNRDAMSSQALNYLCRKDFKSARKLWERCMSSNRRHTDALVGLALCSKMSGDLKGADRFIRRALAVDRNCANAANLRCRRYWPLQLTEAAGRLGKV